MADTFFLRGLRHSKNISILISIIQSRIFNPSYRTIPGRTKKTLELLRDRKTLDEVVENHYYADTSNHCLFLSQIFIVSIFKQVFLAGDMDNYANLSRAQIHQVHTHNFLT